MLTPILVQRRGSKSDHLCHVMPEVSQTRFLNQSSCQECGSSGQHGAVKRKSNSSIGLDSLGLGIIGGRSRWDCICGGDGNLALTVLSSGRTELWRVNMLAEIGLAGVKGKKLTAHVKLTVGLL